MEAPILVIAPFAPASLPGVAGATDRYAFAGDVTDQGALPPLIRLTSKAFHLTDNTAVLPSDDMADAWAALGADENYLPAQTDGVDGAVEIRTRRAVPVVYC